MASKHQALEDGLGKDKGRAKHWERKAKEGIERIAGMEKRGRKPKLKLKSLGLAAVEVGDAKARVEEAMGRVREPLAAIEEAKNKAEAEAARLGVERTSLLLDIGVAKDEVSWRRTTRRPWS